MKHSRASARLYRELRNATNCCFSLAVRFMRNCGLGGRVMPMRIRLPSSSRLYAVTLATTTLLREAYLELAGKSGAALPDCARFMGYAACVMRGLIAMEKHDLPAVQWREGNGLVGKMQPIVLLADTKRVAAGVGFHSTPKCRFRRASKHGVLGHARGLGGVQCRCNWLHSHLLHQVPESSFLRR